MDPSNRVQCVIVSDDNPEALCGLSRCSHCPQLSSMAHVHTAELFRHSDNLPFESLYSSLMLCGFGRFPSDVGFCVFYVLFHAFVSLSLV